MKLIYDNERQPITVNVTCTAFLRFNQMIMSGFNKLAGVTAIYERQEGGYWFKLLDGKEVLAADYSDSIVVLHYSIDYCLNERGNNNA